MEGGRRDFESFLKSVDSLGGSAGFDENLAYPALAGHAETDPADAWEHLIQTSGTWPLLGEPHSDGSEIAGQIFRMWMLRDPEAAKEALKEYAGGLEWSAEWDDQTTAALSAIIRVAGPDVVPGLTGPLDGSDLYAALRRAEIAAAVAVHDVAAAQKLGSDAEHSARFIARWTRDDPDAALSYATSLGTRDALLAVATGLFRDDPRRAMELLYSLNDPEAAKACIGTWKNGDHDDDGAWPVFEGAAPRVSRVTRKDAILIALHRFQQPE
jgi:hypothetical protein